MKLCKYCNKAPVFSHDYCRAHQWMRKDEQYLQYKDLKKKGRISKKPIAKESPKRKVENKRYLQRIKEFWETAVNNGTNQCFFCGETMKERQDIHHLLGRGSIVLEEQWWVLAHRDCHMAYHFDSADKLRQYPWFNDFLSRLKEKSASTYYAVLNRINKAELQFED